MNMRCRFFPPMELAASAEKQEIEQFVLFYVPYVVVRTRSTIDLSTLFFSYNATEWINPLDESGKTEVSQDDKDRPSAQN